MIDLANEIQFYVHLLPNIRFFLYAYFHKNPYMIEF